MSPAKDPMPFDDEIRAAKHAPSRGGAEQPLDAHSHAASVDESRGTRAEALGGKERGVANDVDLQEERRPMSLSDAGRRGGERRRAALGPQGYAAIGRKGGEAVKAKYGPEWYREIGRRGGQRRVEQSRAERDAAEAQRTRAKGGDPQGLNFQAGATEGSASGPSRAKDTGSSGMRRPQSGSGEAPKD